MADANPQGTTVGPDTILVSAVVRDEVEADRAELHVTIQGSSLVTGDMALTRAREVGQLVTELKNVGVDEADIMLERVHAITATGMVGKSSSAQYAFCIVCRDLKRLPDVLGVITSQKNTSLNFFHWRYPDNEERWLALLEECLKRVKVKADRVAAGLDVALLGVHRFVERRADAEEHPTEPSSILRSMVPAGRVRRVGDEDFGLEVSHSMRIAARVEVEYRVSGFTNTSKEAAQP